MVAVLTAVLPGSIQQLRVEVPIWFVQDGQGRYDVGVLCFRKLSGDGLDDGLGTIYVGLQGGPIRRSLMATIVES
jgi:hypothetical protein